MDARKRSIVLLMPQDSVYYKINDHNATKTTALSRFLEAECPSIIFLLKPVNHVFLFLLLLPFFC